MIYLHKGDENSSGTIQIVDEDRLCFLVSSMSKGSRGVRTISKQLLEEFIQWELQHPNGKAQDARDDLCGKTEIDRFEYGYSATLYALAKLNREIAADRPLKSMPLSTPAQLQQIFYGAPGTGKSHTINCETKGEDVIRTTFHPDTDYASFVGAYKPTTVEEEVMTVIGTKAVPVENADGTHRTESKIVYEFVQQAFLQAYTQAWKKYAATANFDCKIYSANRELFPQVGKPSLSVEKQFLVIEEINRGNCAQIFGDLFQLLDRNDAGFSDYPITADADMKRQLAKAFKGLEVEQAEEINALYDGRDVVGEVLSGDILLLPNNLYIWATMNTSDQSLFPIDSAFKRRWDWTYRPISDARLGWKIEADGMLYDWWDFLERINQEIGATTNSEDKKLGYFFCKAKEGRISAETFVGKVVFYLWNDVFKDYELSNSFFDDGKGGKLTFDKFYSVEENETRIAEESIALFMQNLGMEGEEEFDTEDDDEDNRNNGKRDTTKYSINGEGKYPKKKVASELVRRYIKKNPSLSATQVVNEWKTLGNLVSHFIETEAEYNLRTDEPRVKELNCNGEKVYVSTNGWGGKEKMQQLKNAVESKDWGLSIEEITE
ncbi:MAG: AAA family ATPase [Alloprevotella sp.]